METITFYQTQYKNYSDLIASIDPISNDIKQYINKEIKKFFAKSFFSHYDYLTIFQKEHNISYKISLAQTEAKTNLFSATNSLLLPNIDAYIFEVEDTYLVGFSNFDNYNDLKEILEPHKQYELLKKCNVEYLDENSWRKTIINTSKIQLITGWTDYSPNSEERAEEQTFNLLINFQNKEINSNLLDKINFNDSYKKHSQYNAVKNKLEQVIQKDFEIYKEQIIKDNKIELFNNRNNKL